MAETMIRGAGNRRLVLAGTALLVLVAGCGQQQGVEPSQGAAEPSRRAAEPSKAKPPAVSSCTTGRPIARAPERTATPSPGTKDTSDHSFQRESSDLRKEWGAIGDAADYDAEVKLPDGGRVAMFVCIGRGLFAQHYSAEAQGWTEPKAIYRTSSDPCQGARLSARGGTVAAIADFGRFCYDGEPPRESIAAIGRGDPLSWDHHLTKNFDGWTRVSIAAGGQQATFSYKEDAEMSPRQAKKPPDATIRWTRARGFSTPLPRES